MDWKHISSLEPEKLTDENKDELLNTIAWYDLDTEEIDMKRCMLLLKISQQIMKYKSEQVEALVAELDEIAIKQGEKEMKRQESEYDSKSVRSKKSSSFEIDELEEKYREVKTKLKLQVKNNEKQKKELDKLNNHVKLLDEERVHLQNELQSLQQEDAHSDISEAVKEQHRELVDSVHNKNRQISKLLNEIEIMESENVLLRESLSNTKDKLAEATSQINRLSEELIGNKVAIEEYIETIRTLGHENESLKSEVQDIDEEKRKYKKQLTEFALEIDSRVDEWKRILDEKNEEIRRLKKVSETKKKSSSSLISDDDFEPKGQIAALNKVIAESDTKILQLQKELQAATKEMQDTTEILNKLTNERDLYRVQVTEVKQSLKELKNQLKQNNARCQDQQEQVLFLENLSAKKDQELKIFLDKLKEDGHIELSEVIAKLQIVKSQKRYKDKQITDLIKANNDLQESLLEMERENLEMRSRLGLTDKDTVYVAGVLTKERKRKKTLQELQKKIASLEEENLSLRLEQQSFSRDLDRQQTKLKSGKDQAGKIKEDVKPSGAPSVTEEAHKALVEENEALRKGLHEILESLQIRTDKGLREIRSETLEQLLRALDVKHISGWYHPAMRLQAELHTLQGSNMELREQLKTTRMEVHNLQKSGESKLNEKTEPLRQLNIPIISSDSNLDVISNLNKHLLQVMKENENVSLKNVELVKDLEKHQTAFNTLEHQIALLYKQYSEEKAGWNKDKEMFGKTTDEVTEKIEVLENKLKDISKFANASKDEQLKLKQISEMSGTIVLLNRKSLHLENENNRLIKELKMAKQDLLDAEVAIKTKINSMCIEKNSLSKTIDILKNQVSNTINLSDHKKLLNDFDNLTLKHRTLLNNVTEICTQGNEKTNLMKASIGLLKNEKDELQNKLKDVILKLNTFEVSTFEVDKAIEALSKKVAQIEVNEITERQRANHMTNLYELVKEQLRKSEERYQESEKYSKDLMHKNLSLQECLKDYQDKSIDAVDLRDYSAIKDRCGKLLEDNAKLAKEVQSLQAELESSKKPIDVQKLWSSAQEYEFLSLKHQILDLQANTDDKAVISRLSSDVVHARLKEAEAEQKIATILSDQKKLEEEYNEYRNSAEEEYIRLNEHIKMLTDKVSVLQQTIKQQREQYFGFVPMTSESKFVDTLIRVTKDKHEAFLSLQKADEQKHESELIKEQLREQLKLAAELKTFAKDDDTISKWFNEKCLSQLQELKHRRRTEFVESQLRQALDRIEEQDRLLSRLEEELLQAYRKTEFSLPPLVESVKLHESGKIDAPSADEVECKVRLFKSQETQTIFDVSPKSESDKDDDALKQLHVELVNAQKENALKDELNEQLKSKQVELEMNISMFKTQLGDKQSQITFYEKHILELQNKKDLASENATPKHAVDINSNEENLTLKATIATLQSTLAEKETAILKYQSLLKQDRDEHSLAAARMQEELKKLQAALISHQNAYKELKENQHEISPSKIAVGQYIKQVHNLEDHTAELHTRITTLESQLQTSREECVRWRALSNDRLQSMENLRQELETAHRNEVSVYKDECEKWRQEVISVKTLLVKHTDNTNDTVNSVQKVLKERDERIRELMSQLRQMRLEARKRQESVEIPKLQELELENEQLGKELDTLRKRHEQLLNREKGARDEIRSLKAQLMKRPVSSARSDKSDTLKEHLHKKVCTLEKEVEDLRENLKEQLTINEQHRMKVNEDFEKWNKQKYWQQNAEKFKAKLKEKTDECEKVQQTCSGYRILIERLEKEKHALEMKNKALRGMSANVGGVKLEMLEIENSKLQAELEALTMKLEMHQHHSGGLGAAMLQDKLEGQERKIAVLELATKGTGELRAELERIQTLNASLQKSNLRLEAENLEFKLDLEKSSRELPHLREQIQHLENYMEVLKRDMSPKHEVTNSGDHVGNYSKKVSELERTVFVLKRIVEKLQAENKRLQGGGGKTVSDKVPDETLRRDFYRLKDQYGDSVQKIARLEEELKAANNKMKHFHEKQADTSELDEVKMQLSQKGELLDKVKVLLHRAAVKEKSLMEEISALKAMVPSSVPSVSSN